MLKSLEKQNSMLAQSHPKWLDQDLFNDLLTDTVPDFKSIVKFWVEPSTDSISSLLTWKIRILIQLKDAKTKTVSYLLETPLDATHPNITSPAFSFEKESVMFDELLPAFEELYNVAGKSVKLSTSSSKFSKPPASAYVLLDLRANGYSTIERSTVQCDSRHSKAFLEKLAAFHAASAVYVEKVGAFPRIYSQANYSREQLELYEAHHRNSQRKFHECLRFYDLREYQDKIKAYQELYNDELHKLDEADRHEFNVLLHGECNLRNVLYQHDAFGNIKDTVLLNFHSSQYGPPAKDLWYLLMNSVHQTDILTHFDSYMKFYHDQLIANLKCLDYSKSLPKLTDLHVSMMKYSAWGYTAMTKHLPLSYCGSSAQALNNCSEYELLKALYETPDYYKEIEGLLPWMENRAFIEI